MIAKTGFKLGDTTYQFEIDEKDDMESISKAIVLGNPPTDCNVCRDDLGQENFKLTTNKDKEGNIYVNVKHKCGARAKLGQYKSGGFFWHEFEVYVKNTQEGK